MCGQRLTATAVTDGEGRFRIDDAQRTLRASRRHPRGLPRRRCRWISTRGIHVVDARHGYARGQRGFGIGGRLRGAGRRADLAGRVLGHGHHRSGAPRAAVRRTSRMRFAKCPGCPSSAPEAAGALTSVFPARRRIRLLARADRRRAGQCIRRRLRLLASGGRRHRPHRGRPRPAERALRIERHRRGRARDRRARRPSPRRAPPSRAAASTRHDSRRRRRAARTAGSGARGVERFATDNANGTADRRSARSSTTTTLGPNRRERRLESSLTAWGFAAKSASSATTADFRARSDRIRSARTKASTPSRGKTTIDGSHPSAARSRRAAGSARTPNGRGITLDSDVASPFGPSTAGSRRWTLRASPTCTCAPAWIRPPAWNSSASRRPARSSPTTASRRFR